jgi:serine/threonine protein kinase
VCHRDLKHENVLWESEGEGAEGEPKLIDFGMSRKFAKGAYMTERVGECCCCCCCCKLLL